MTPGHSRNPLAPLGVVAALAAAVLGVAAGTGQGQPPGGAVGRDRAGHAPALKRTFVSSENCLLCHNPGPPARPEEAPEPLPKLVLQTEYKTWNGEDKHRRAFDALKGERGKAMGTLLGFADVSAERACLSCHASGFERDDPDDVLASKARGLGVGCTSCHGPYEEWTEKHYKGVGSNPSWRAKTPESKSREFGMTDLRDPAVRAGVCVSCHVGNPDEGKVVTHAMYARGTRRCPGSRSPRS